MTTTLLWSAAPQPDIRWIGFDPVTNMENTHSPEEQPFPAIVGVIGPPGPSTGVSPYIHTQILTAQVWTVNHNLGRSPASVRVLSVGGVELFCSVVEISLNQLTVTFVSPTTGTVHII